jgi:hypothetical protein
MKRWSRQKTVSRANLTVQLRRLQQSRPHDREAGQKAVGSLNLHKLGLPDPEVAQKVRENEDAHDAVGDISSRDNWRLPTFAEGEIMEGDEAGEEGSEGAGPIGGGKPFRRINGKVYVIEGDEFTTEEDTKGNTKIDAAGRLIGARRFKAQTFNLPQRHPEKMFMLAIDAARTSGFRDSLYYFRRNPLAFKLNATQPEKDYLIEIGKLGPHLRTRSVTLITARSAYKLHGAKMLIGAWVAPTCVACLY